MRRAIEKGDCLLTTKRRIAYGGHAPTMKSPVSKLRQRLLLVLAAIVACTALPACDDYHHHHTYHGYDRRPVVYHDHYYREDYHPYRHDVYYDRPGYRRGPTVVVRSY